MYKMLLIDTKRPAYMKRQASSWVERINIIPPKSTKPNAILIKILLGLCCLFCMII